MNGSSFYRMWTAYKKKEQGKLLFGVVFLVDRILQDVVVFAKIIMLMLWVGKGSDYEYFIAIDLVG